MDTRRKEGENILSYADRLIKNLESKAYDIDKVEIYELITGEKVSYDHARKALAFLAKVIKKHQDENISSIEDSDILEQIRQEKEELMKEKIKVQTENLTKRQLERENARYELFIEHAVSAIEKLEPLKAPDIIIEESHNNISGVLLFADPHYDKVLEIKSLTGQIMNQYNPEIFEERMWNLLRKTVKICKDKNFNHISVMNLGDELEGMLRVGQLMSLKYGIVESGIRFAHFIAGWLNELSKHKIIIDYYSTYGNHTDLRLLTNKKGEFPHENISKFINALVKSELRDNKNIRIIDSIDNKIYANIQGYDILGIHGEEKDPQKAIRDFSFIYPENIDYIVGGHKHHTNVVNCGFRKGYIGVGSIIGIDDYSMSLKKISDPTATFVVFEENNGKIEELTIVLD